MFKAKVIHFEDNGYGHVDAPDSIEGRDLFFHMGEGVFPPETNLDDIELELKLEHPVLAFEVGVDYSDPKHRNRTLACPWTLERFEHLLSEQNLPP